MTNDSTFNGAGTGAHIAASLHALWFGIDVSDIEGTRDYVDALDADRSLFPDVTSGVPLPGRAQLLAQAEHLRACAQCAQTTAQVFVPRVDLPLSPRPEAERDQAIAAAMREFDDLHPVAAQAQQTTVQTKRSWSPFGRKSSGESPGISVSGGGRGVLRPSVALGVAAAVTAATGAFLLQQRSVNDSAAVAADTAAEVETETAGSLETAAGTEGAELAATEAAAEAAAEIEATEAATDDGAVLEKPAAAAPVPSDLTLPEVKAPKTSPELAAKPSAGASNVSSDNAAAEIAEAVGAGQPEPPLAVATTATPTTQDTRKKSANRSTSDQVAFDNPAVENLGDAGEFESLEGARIKVMAVAAAKSRVSKDPKTPETTAPAKEKPSGTSCIAAQNKVVGYVSLIVAQKPAIALFGGEPLTLIEIVDAASCKPLT